MEQLVQDRDDIEQKIQENIANWQSAESPLAPLPLTQMDIIYQIGDLIKDQFYTFNQNPSLHDDDASESSDILKPVIPTITSNKEYIKWMVKVENELKSENLNEYVLHFNHLSDHSNECNLLFKDAQTTLSNLDHLQKEYEQVAVKTDSLHTLSEQLIKHQKQLKDNKQKIKEKLHHFALFNMLSDNVHHHSSNVNTAQFMDTLNKIDDSMNYLNHHSNFKESKTYSIKYESILSKAVIIIRKFINNVITEATRQVTDPDKGLINTEMVGESSFSLYYGKFQSAATKIRPIIGHIESKMEKHNHYQQLISDCQQTYFTQRSPVMSAAIVKALGELRDKHRSDHSVLFRSSGLFVMQVCQDEAGCFYYFFTGPSAQLQEYLGILCQSLYDMLRPSLIGINHLEVLTELCGILRKEMLNDHIQNNCCLDRFAEIIKQLLEDVEERLVFRANVFFQHDLSAYQPSPGDLAYPEKLEQMKNIAEEMSDSRADSRSSIVSVESQEVASINTGQLGQFRSYTGNSPADLHGMWYPTVKRTLVCLSRLYFCLDRETFQGLAQEALSVCVKSIEYAANQITARKSHLDGKLFQIKHLLIIREQIAPFQVDFTITEVTLDFSNVKSAAFGLIQNRDKLFSFNSSNALLEFLLEGTPKVKEYLVDSRKEIDKQLKAACEAFISHATQMLVGNLLLWSQRAENYLKNTNPENSPLSELDFATPQIVSGIVSTAQRNIKAKLPEVQRSMQLYLANKETEFILFRPIKNNVINAFIQLEQILRMAKYSSDDQLMIACLTPEQVNILICSVSLTAEQDHHLSMGSRASQVSNCNVQSKEIVVDSGLN